MLKSLNKFWKRFQSQSESQSDASNTQAAVSRAFRTTLSCYLETRFLIVLGLAFVLYFIAGNIGSGWLYLICACLLGAILMGFLIPMTQVLACDVDQHMQTQAIIGEELNLNCSVHKNVMLPVDWLRLVSIFTGDKLHKVPGPEAAIVVPSLEKKAAFVWKMKADKRGIHKAPVIWLESSFPLGLVWFRKKFIPLTKPSVTIYPKVVPIKGFFLYKLPPSTMSASAIAITNVISRQSTQTVGVREYVRGDSPRFIHWASSARTGRLLVREFEAEGLSAFDVFLNLCAPWANEKQFELAICAAASLLSLGHSIGIGPRLLLHPDIDLLQEKFELPAVTPGIEEQMEILARIFPVSSKEDTKLFNMPLSLPLSRQKALIEISPSEIPCCPQTSYLVEVVAKAREPGQTAGGAQEFPAKSIVACEDDICQL